MKSNIFKTMAVVVTAIFAGYNVYLTQAENNNVVSDALLANVEALAQSEELPEIIVTCSASCRDGIGKCWKRHPDDNIYCTRSESPQNYCSCAHLPG